MQILQTMPPCMCDACKFIVGPVFGGYGAWECATVYHVNVIAVGVVVGVAI